LRLHASSADLYEEDLSQVGGSRTEGDQGDILVQDGDQGIFAPVGWVDSGVWRLDPFFGKEAFPPKTFQLIVRNDPRGESAPAGLSLLCPKSPATAPRADRELGSGDALGELRDAIVLLHDLAIAQLAQQSFDPI
jgi:hypothetical protein